MPGPRRTQRVLNGAVGPGPLGATSAGTACLSIWATKKGALVVDETGFIKIMARASDAGVPWRLGDESYGLDRRLRMALKGREQPFVLVVRGNEKLWSMLDGSMNQHAAAALAAAMSAKNWHRPGTGAGACP